MAGEAAQQFKGYIAMAESLNFVPSTHAGWLIMACNSSFMKSETIFTHWEAAGKIIFNKTRNIVFNIFLLIYNCNCVTGPQLQIIYNLLNTNFSHLKLQTVQ